MVAMNPVEDIRQGDTRPIYANYAIVEKRSQNFRYSTFVFGFWPKPTFGVEI